MATTRAPERAPEGSQNEHVPLVACQQALGLLQACLLRQAGNARSGEGGSCPEAALAAALDFLKLSMQAWLTHLPPPAFNLLLLLLLTSLIPSSTRPLAWTAPPPRTPQLIHIRQDVPQRLTVCHQECPWRWDPTNFLFVLFFPFKRTLQISFHDPFMLTLFLMRPRLSRSGSPADQSC